MSQGPSDDVTSRFDWVGKSKEEQAANQPTAPDAKEAMPTTINFVFRDYYYEVVNIDIGEGYKIMREKIRSSWKDMKFKTALAVVNVPLPCGMVLATVENDESRISGVVEVIELIEGGNAEKAGIKVGDAFRGCNATVNKKVEDATAFIEADTRRTRALF
jgi:C-terminal processing protease CtpA/Prc